MYIQTKHRNHPTLALVLALLTLCALLFTPAALADDAAASPEYATVEIGLPDVDIDAIISAFYGDHAGKLKLDSQIYEFNGTRVEVTSGSLPDCEYAFSYSGNYINMQRHHEIPLSYRSEGEGVYLPPPSKVEGKYTEDEAIELAQRFIQEDLHIAADTGLIVADVRPEDASKERSRSYVISFAYAWEGVPLIGTTEQLPQVTPTLTVGVTDEGIVSLEGCILELTGGRQSESALLPSDELTRINPNDTMLANADCIHLCYKVGPTHEGRLAWYAVDEGEPIPTYVNLGYDAYTGEKLA